jgi:hypothetical protein
VFSRIARATFAAAILAAFTTGVALASDCNANYCPGPADPDLCVTIDQTVQDVCCVSLGGPNLQCAMSSREVFWCFNGEACQEVLGTPFNCQSLGQPCQ